jgi:spore germination protein PE
MFQRTSWVDRINVNIVSFSSVVQVGDSCIINGFSRALAVQREAEIFFGNESNYANYPVFYKTIPLPTITEPITILRHNQNPLIKVKNIDIIGISSSSMLHVGNSNHVSEEVRVKHIRQLLSPGDEQGQR